MFTFSWSSMRFRVRVAEWEDGVLLVSPVVPVLLSILHKIRIALAKRCDNSLIISVSATGGFRFFASAIICITYLSLDAFIREYLSSLGWTRTLHWAYSLQFSLCLPILHTYQLYLVLLRAVSLFCSSHVYLSLLFYQHHLIGLILFRSIFRSWMGFLFFPPANFPRFIDSSTWLRYM